MDTSEPRHSPPSRRMEPPSPRGPWPQDTLNVREKRISYDQSYLARMWGEAYPPPEEHSMFEDDSDPDEPNDNDTGNDDSSSLSVPIGSIDFNLVYPLHKFAATVEGQASVTKGEDLVLMDDTNSYWWLVRVLRTREVGYIPADNIENPFERLARFNKLRNVDLASPTLAEMQDGLQESRDHFRNIMSSRAGPNQQSPFPTSNDPRVMTPSRRSIAFTPALQVHRYPPAAWGDDKEVDGDDEWDVGSYADEDPSLAEEAVLVEQERRGGDGSDDGWSWEEALPEPSRARGPTIEQRRQQEFQAQHSQQQLQQQQEGGQQAAEQHQQQRGQQVEEQRDHQQIMAQTMAGQAGATSTQELGLLSIRRQVSCEQLVLPQDPSSVSPSFPSTSARSMDPINSSETKKMSVTPLLVQGNNQHGQPPRQALPRTTGPMRPSEVTQRQEEEHKRARDKIGALEEAARNKARQSSSGRSQGGAKLRKEPLSSDDDSSRDKDKKGKSGGLFGRLFDWRKDREKGTNDSIDISQPIEVRSSEEPGRSSSHTDNSGGPQTPPRRGPALTNTSPPVSLHASSLRQRDKEQQTLYRQHYLTRSPASPPEAQQLLQISPVNSGQASIASTLSPTSDCRRPRPGSLLIGGNINRDGSSLVPELSVLRIFAGKKLQTEATFKTVLLDSSTSSEELVKQAIQRFRLPAGEDAMDYCLTVKRLEGSSAELRPEEKPLVVFETLAEAALDLPKVKRSSVGSISSIASNLSQHPAIKKLPMNDFTDDTAVKIYLNRRSESTSDEGETMECDTTTDNGSVSGDGESGEVPLHPRLHDLSTIGVSVPSERFSSAPFRFALRLLIYPDDLPDDMVFDPLTEAVVFKNTLRDRPQVVASSAPFRRKIFMFPKNITVAEVIEIGLERFGIQDGVVDGVDEVEDKNTKERSSSHVRYVLNMLVDGNLLEHELMPSGKVIDFYPRPPNYRPANRRFSDAKRRSIDSMQLLGQPDDVSPKDPVFALRRPRSHTSIISVG